MHLLSQNHLTGAEVYAVNLCEQQIHQGHLVVQVSNGFFTKTDARKITFDVETRGRFEFIKNVFRLRKLITGSAIQVIHCHSRAAAKLAYWARLGLPVGLVSTIHGRQHPSISKKIWNTYGDYLVPVCENIETQLRTVFNYNPKQLKLLRNPISKDLFYFSKNSFVIQENIKNKKLRIAVMGRTTGPKGKRTELVLNLLPSVLGSLNIKAEYFLVGGKKSDLNLITKEKIIEIDVDRFTSAEYEGYDLIIGSGRVALEALVTGIPLIAFGEASYEGLITPSRLAEAYKSNFGDIHTRSFAPTLDSDRFQKDISDLVRLQLSAADLEQMSKKIFEDFNSEKIARKITRLYESSYFQRNFSRWIPILMYHKVPNQEIKSQHQIFVTAENFKKHLQFYKSRGLTTVTFNELKEFKSGKKDFKSFPKKPLILTFDDGYRDNLENASPLLFQFGFKAQLFLLADPKVNSNYWDHSASEPSHDIVSGADRSQWKSSAFEIGSHGFSHQKITEMTESEARQELKLSKQSLESEFNAQVSVYAFTYGDTNTDCARLAEEEGYDYAVNTDTGGLLLEENPYQIFRVNIFPNETKLSLFKKTSSWYRGYYFKKRKK